MRTDPGTRRPDDLDRAVGMSPNRDRLHRGSRLMHRLGFWIAPLALLLGLSGCGGGVQGGIPPGVGQSLTPEQQKEHDALVAEEEAQAKAQGKGRRGP